MRTHFAVLSLCWLSLALGLVPAAAPPRVPLRNPRHMPIFAVDEGEPDRTEDLEDWREMRARLVAGEKGAAGSDAEAAAGFVYESPLIEQGSVILGGTMQDFGFALRQQYFHKCVSACHHRFAVFLCSMPRLL